MKTEEVLKGSGQILFEPQTISAVANYIIQDLPAEESARFKVQRVFIAAIRVMVKQ